MTNQSREFLGVGWKFPLQVTSGGIIAQAKYEQRIAAARTALGDDAAFDRAWQEGRAMPLEKAIELALQ